MLHHFALWQLLLAASIEKYISWSYVTCSSLQTYKDVTFWTYRMTGKFDKSGYFGWKTRRKEKKMLASLGDLLSTFQDSTVVTSSRDGSPVLLTSILRYIFRSWKMRPPGCLERSGTDHPVTWLHIPEERRPRLRRCQKLKPATLWCTDLNGRIIFT